MTFIKFAFSNDGDQKYFFVDGCVCILEKVKGLDDKIWAI